MPRVCCVAEKETFYSTDFNVSYYLHVAVWHDYLSLSVCLGIYPAHHSQIMLMHDALWKNVFNQRKPANVLFIYLFMLMSAS